MFKINVKLFKRESVVFVAKVKSRSFHPDVFIIFWPPYWFVMDVHKMSDHCWQYELIFYDEKLKFHSPC